MALRRVVRRLLGRPPELELDVDLDTDEDRRRRTLIVVSIWLTVVLVGVPVWWKTTEVYRAPLPFAEMASWAEDGATDYTIPISVTLHLPPRALPADSAARLPGIVESAVNAVFDRRGAELEGFDRRTGGEGEGRAVDVQPPRPRFAFSLSVSTDVQDSWGGMPEWDLDDKLGSLFPSATHGSYHVVLLPTLPPHSWKIYAGRFRTLLVHLPEAYAGDTERLEAFGDAAVTAITGVFGSELYHLRKSVSEDTARQIDVLRTVKYSPEYLITFTLLNADPNEVLVTWDIDEALRAYFSPLVRSLSSISNITLSSQILYHSNLPMPPNRATGLSDHPFYFFRPEHLPHFVNTAEWNLASVSTSALPINLLVYVPKRSEYPLHVLDAGKQILPTNAWLVPGWGGAVISNAPLEKTGVGNLTLPPSGPVPFRFTRAELKPVLEIFVSQARELLGVQPMLIEQDFLSPPGTLPRYPLVAAAADPDRGVTDWEVDRLKRKRTARNVLDAARGLVSLGKLVSGMPNMVVPDRIAEGVGAALRSLRSCGELVAQGELDAAFAASRDALARSEAAFFDPTMVSMLYFPDEHRYAVYMPFFVPVGVPLVVGLLSEIRRWRERRKKAKTD
ncbi:phosphatidylinositol-glycan biosynthesis class S protein [Hyaloraphidium curvatum]|nr:phosphatidylinositol-glycan biosynthesis class S protein [Hyaloraphidium curvatum]